MCNLEVVSQKGGICWTYTMGQHKEIPDRICQYIWNWSVGNVGHHFSRDGKNAQIQRVLIEGRGLETS